MDNMVLMQILQPKKQLFHDISNLPHIHRVLLLLHESIQIIIHVIQADMHHWKGVLHPLDQHFVDIEDVGVVEVLQKPDFSDGCDGKPFLELVILQIGHLLDGYNPSCSPILGFVYAPVCPASYFYELAVVVVQVVAAPLIRGKGFEHCGEALFLLLYVHVFK